MAPESKFWGWRIHLQKFRFSDQMKMAPRCLWCRFIRMHRRKIARTGWKDKQSTAANIWRHLVARDSTDRFAFSGWMFYYDLRLLSSCLPSSQEIEIDINVHILKTIAKFSPVFLTRE